MQQSKLLTHAARIWTFGKSFDAKRRNGKGELTSHVTDGGGPSVISQLLIVNEIMLQIQSILELEEAPKPCDYADLMVGSGLGAYVHLSMNSWLLTEYNLPVLLSFYWHVFVLPQGRH
jgi:hypothetical protein